MNFLDTCFTPEDCGKLIQFWRAYMFFNLGNSPPGKVWILQIFIYTLWKTITHPTEKGKGQSSTQKWIGKRYVSSHEAMIFIDFSFDERCNLMQILLTKWDQFLFGRAEGDACPKHGATMCVACDQGAGGVGHTEVMMTDLQSLRVFISFFKRLQLQVSCPSHGCCNWWCGLVLLEAEMTKKSTIVCPNWWLLVGVALFEGEVLGLDQTSKNATFSLPYLVLKSP